MTAFLPAVFSRRHGLDRCSQALNCTLELIGLPESFILRNQATNAKLAIMRAIKAVD
jgi:hypothetical protein